MGSYDILRLDGMSLGDSAIHRLDPRAKIVTTLLFVVLVVSFGRFEVTALVPLLLYPIAIAMLGGVPLGYMALRIAIAAPFAIMVGLFNPLIDRNVAFHLGPWPISWGWISLLSIAERFILTVGAAITLVAVTDFHSLCAGLDRLGVPRVLVVQLLFLHRYLTVLTEQAQSMARARAFRSTGRRGLGIRSYGSVLGHLLLRTYDRARRIHLAMLCRGFDGEVRLASPMHVRSRDVLYVLGWAAFFAAARLHDLPALLGRLVAGSAP